MASDEVDERLYYQGAMITTLNTLVDAMHLRIKALEKAAGIDSDEKWPEVKPE